MKLYRPLFRALWTLELDFLLCNLRLKYLETWGLAHRSLLQKIALAYLLNLELKKINFFDRFALTLSCMINKETNSLFNRLVNFYIVKRGLHTQALFGLISNAFLRLLRRRNRNSVFDEMALMYILARCNEAVSKGLSMSGLDEVFDLAKIEGIDLINLNLELILETPLSFETAKLVSAGRLTKAFESETLDEFQFQMEMGYWTGALERLIALENEEN